MNKYSVFISDNMVQARIGVQENDPTGRMSLAMTE